SVPCKDEGVDDDGNGSGGGGGDGDGGIAAVAFIASGGGDGRRGDAQDEPRGAGDAGGDLVVVGAVDAGSREGEAEEQVPGTDAGADLVVAFGLVRAVDSEGVEPGEDGPREEMPVAIPVLVAVVRSGVRARGWGRGRWVDKDVGLVHRGLGFLG